MKKLRYISAVILIMLFVMLTAVMYGGERFILYASGVILNEIIPSNVCGQDMNSAIICELIPGLRVGFIDGEGKNYGYELVPDTETDGVFEAALESDEQTEAETDALQEADNTEAGESADTSSEAAAETALTIISTDGMVEGPTPITYSMTQLSDFETLLSECYVVDSSTTVTEDELDAEKLLDMDMSISASDEIKVLIYHTHGSEAFADSRDGVVEDTIIGVGDELARILEDTYGIKVYHDRNIYDNINGVIDRSNAYNLSGAAIDEILEKYPSIEVVLDLHRDGVNDEVRLVRTVDGKETAQIMFLNGVSRLKSSGDIEYLYNPHKDENLSFSLKLFLNGRSLYGDLIRKIYIRGYCFNLDRIARSSLIEVGAQTNTVEEAKNAMVPLARILNQVLLVKAVNP